MNSAEREKHRGDQIRTPGCSEENPACSDSTEAVRVPDGQVRSGSWREIHDRAGGCSVGTARGKSKCLPCMHSFRLSESISTPTNKLNPCNRPAHSSATERWDLLRFIAPARLSSK